MALPAPKGALSVEGVYAVPPGANLPALRGVSFTIEPGEVLGVVGSPLKKRKPTPAAKEQIGLFDE